MSFTSLIANASKYHQQAAHVRHTLCNLRAHTCSRTVAKATLFSIVCPPPRPPPAPPCLGVQDLGPRHAVPNVDLRGQAVHPLLSFIQDQLVAQQPAGRRGERVWGVGFRLTQGRGPAACGGEGRGTGVGCGVQADMRWWPSSLRGGGEGRVGK